jgi:hypothetical protein
MIFIVITGPQAVGKMTVGFELAKLLDLKVFHNHMTIEPVVKLFEYHTKEAQYLNSLFRREIFNQMAKSNQNGFIFTYVWDFNDIHDHNYVNNIFSLFEQNYAKTYLVELESDINIRLSRNVTALRLEEKPTKRNTDWSNNELIESMNKYRMNSNPGELNYNNYFRLNNSNLSPQEAAIEIVKFFELK